MGTNVIWVAVFAASLSQAQPGASAGGAFQVAMTLQVGGDGGRSGDAVN